MLITLVLPSSLVLAAAAAGSAFYNESSSGKPDPALVHLSCGVFCENNFNIKPGKSAARPGKRGHFILDNDGGFTGRPANACQFNSLKVDDHGYGQLEFTSRYRWLVFGNDSSQVSGSPFAIRSGTWNPDIEVGPVGCG